MSGMMPGAIPRLQDSKEDVARLDALDSGVLR
jgi:hypothetical protein